MEETCKNCADLRRELSERDDKIKSLAYSLGSSLDDLKIKVLEIESKNRLLERLSISLRSLKEQQNSAIKRQIIAERAARQTIIINIQLQNKISQLESYIQQMRKETDSVYKFDHLKKMASQKVELKSNVYQLKQLIDYLIFSWQGYQLSDDKLFLRGKEVTDKQSVLSNLLAVENKSEENNYIKRIVNIASQLSGAE